MNPDNQNELIPRSLGETLNLAREKQGLSLEAIAAEIHVRPSVLRAIETDDTAGIPRVYLKGYIRRYAQRLNIPAADIESLLGEAPCSEPVVQSVFSEALPRDRSERWFKATSYVLASAVVIALVWQFTTEAVRFSQGETLPRTSAGEGSSPAATESSGQPDERNASAGEAARPDGAKSHLRASIAAMEPARPNRSANRRTVAEEAWAAVGNRTTNAAMTEESASPGGDAALTIATSADSWVEIVDGAGQRVEMDLLRAGSRRSYHGNGPFRLLLGRASAIELVYNGKPVDLGPHTRGNVARVTLGGDPPAAGLEPAPASATEPPAGEG